MKHFLLFAILLNLSLSAQQSGITQFADSIMLAKYKADSPGAVLLIAQNGTPVYKKAYGMASMELNVTMNTKNIFPLASVSKQFTAVCMLQLAQEGKLTLKDDIQKYIPAYNSHGRIITIENILYQTSGITSYTEKNDYDSVMTIAHTPKQIMKYFMDDSLLFEPGTDWSYSNSNYTLAGIIIENVSGLTLGQYYSQHIFLPLGMRNTFMNHRDSINVGSVSGYEQAETGKYTLHLPNGQDIHYSTGFGVTNRDGVQYIEHGGADHGFQSGILRIPANHTYIIVLSNNEAGNLYDIPWTIAFRMLNISIPKAAIKYPSLKTIAQDTGIFLIHHMYARVTWNFTPLKQYRTIFIKGDSLYAKATYDKSPEAILFVSEDLFIGNESGMMYRFIRDSKRKVVSLEYYSEPLRYGPDDVEVRN